MKKINLIVLFILAIVISANSQTKQEQIRELFKVMKQDSLMEEMGKNMVQTIMMQQQMVKKARPEMIGRSTERLDKLMDANQMVEKTMNIMKKFVKNDMVDIYDKHFNEAEIKDYIQFYKSPAGQKFQKEMPKLQNDIMQVMMQKYMPEMMKEYEQEIEKHLEKAQP